MQSYNYLSLKKCNDLHQSVNRVVILANCGILIPLFYFYCRFFLVITINYLSIISNEKKICKYFHNRFWKLFPLSFKGRGKQFIGEKFAFFSAMKNSLYNFLYFLCFLTYSVFMYSIVFIVLHILVEKDKPCKCKLIYFEASIVLRG